MPCRVGITTRPDERKGEWENQVIGLKNWKILSVHETKEEAQKVEDLYAKSSGCEAHHGGAGNGSKWYVYTFDYTRSK